MSALISTNYIPQKESRTSDRKKWYLMTSEAILFGIFTEIKDLNINYDPTRCNGALCICPLCQFKAECSEERQKMNMPFSLSETK